MPTTFIAHRDYYSGAGVSYNTTSSSAILDDAGSVVDDPAVSSANASVASKPNSSHSANNENAKPFFDANAPRSLLSSSSRLALT